MEGVEGVAPPKENEIQGPLHFVTVEIPSKLLNDPSFSDEKLLELVRQKTDQSVASSLDSNSQSQDFAYRGFVREVNVEGLYTNSWEDIRYNAKYVEDRLHQAGMEKSVKLGETDEILTTQSPSRAIGFAKPRRDNEVGYLIVYDNHDGIFNPNSDLQWVNILEVESDTTLRDKIRTVIVIKPEEHRSRLASLVSRLRK